MEVNSFSKVDLLFWVIHRVGEYVGINPMFYSITTCDNNPIFHGMDEVIIQNIFPDSLDQLTSTVSHKLATLVSQTYSGRSLNVLEGPGVESRVQLAAIDCRSVACVLEGSKRKVTRKGPTDPRVSTKSGVSGVFPEWIREVRSSGELRS